MPPNAETVYRGRYLHYFRAANGWEYVSRANAKAGVTIVAVTDEGRLILVEQYRTPLGTWAIELPAGLVGDGLNAEVQDYELAVKRELEEETGYKCKGTTFLCEGSTSPGLTDEKNALYRATGLQRCDDASNDRTFEDGSVTHSQRRGLAEEREEITVHEVPVDSITVWLERQRKEGKIIDLRVYAGLHFVGRT